MKKLFATLCVLCAFAFRLSAQTNVYFTNLVMIGTADDTTINIKAVNNPVVWQGRVYRLPVNGTNIMTVGGVGTIVLVPGKYIAAYAGIPQSFQFTVTNSATAMNVTDLIDSGHGVVIYSGVETIEGTGGLTVTPPTGPGGKWTIDASGVSGGGGGSGNVTGPGSSQQHHLAAFANTSGQLLEDSGIPFANIVLIAWMQATNAAFQAQLVASNTAYQTQFSARPIFNQTVSNMTGGTYITVTPTTLPNGQRSFASDMTDQQFKNAYAANIADMALEADFEAHTNSLATSAFGDASGLSFGTLSPDRLSFASSNLVGNVRGFPGLSITFSTNTHGVVTPTLVNDAVVTNNLQGGMFTNFGVVWYATNGTPQVALPNGSLCLQTSGQMWLRTNSAWVTINISGTSSGGSGTVTSVGLSGPSELTISGSPITGSGTLSFSRTAGASADYAGQNGTNFAKLNATNSLLVGGTVGVDPTNVVQVNTLGGTKKVQINTNGDAFFSGLVKASSFNGNGAALTSLSGGNMTAGTLSSNAMDAGTEAQLFSSDFTGRGLTLDQWFIQTNAVNHALNFSNATTGITFVLPTNGPPIFNGQSVTNIQGSNVVGVVSWAGALNAGQFLILNGSLEPTNTLDGGALTNLQAPEWILPVTSQATNYTINVAQRRKQKLFTANTNANFTFSNIGTNKEIDLYIDALTSTVPCNITFPPHMILNHSAVLSVTNGQMTIAHIDFWDGTDPTNGVVSVGDYYLRQ